jgi:hypothetical protein
VGLDELTGRFGYRYGRVLWNYYRDHLAWTNAQIANRYGVTLETVRTYSRALRKAGHFPTAVPVSGIYEDLLASLEMQAQTNTQSIALVIPEQAPAA